MAVSKSNKKKQSYITVSSQIISSIPSNSLESTPFSLKKKSTPLFTFPTKLRSLLKNPRFWVFLIFIFGFIGLCLNTSFEFEPFFPLKPNPCRISQEKSFLDNGISISELAHESKVVKYVDGEGGFWKQPNGLGYRPCLEFTREYKRVSGEVIKEKSNYLMVVVSGGINQQKNQIVDAVVIARILGASLVIPILQVNVIWGDESEFSDIFDLDHFKNVLKNDVRIVSSLPSTHLMTRPIEEKQTPVNVSPQWIRSRYLRKLKREGVLLLRGLDSRLSKDLRHDLQKLRCKVAFDALRFAQPILELGNKLTERMRIKGPYMALHLRMEKDVWVRTGCLPGLSSEYDEMINNERKQRPDLLTSRSNMTYHERKMAGLCPLNAMEVVRLLKALGAPKTASIYWAGGNPLGGKEALYPLIQEFPHFYNKEDLALPGELEPFDGKASFLAAIDHIVSVNSDVFMPHGGNMGHAIQGQRAYAGHKKTITPNKRQMFSHFLNTSINEVEFNKIIQELHRDSLGQPDLRTIKFGKDVTKYPTMVCMCNSTTKKSHI